MVAPAAMWHHCIHSNQHLNTCKVISSWLSLRHKSIFCVGLNDKKHGCEVAVGVAIGGPGPGYMGWTWPRKIQRNKRKGENSIIEAEANSTVLIMKTGCIGRLRNLVGTN